MWLRHYPHLKCCYFPTCELFQLPIYSDSGYHVSALILFILKTYRHFPHAWFGVMMCMWVVKYRLINLFHFSSICDVCLFIIEAILLVIYIIVFNLSMGFYRYGLIYRFPNSPHKIKLSPSKRVISNKTLNILFGLKIFLINPCF